MSDVDKQIEALTKAQEELEKQIDDEIKQEDEVIHAIEETVSSLLLYKQANVEINGTKYIVKCKIIETGKTVKNAKGQTEVERQVILMAADKLKAEIMQKRYIPATVRADYNYNLTQKGNITVAVEGWIRHITGLIKPEMLED